MFLTELAEPQLLVIYPGRFQPFHKGHHAVYAWLCGKFGRNNVYIATSNKVDGDRSPFTFSEKAYFMQLTGVPADRIIQATSPYQIDSVLSSGQIQVGNRGNTVAVFAVSQKDMDEDPRFSFGTKKDGTASYFQPLKDIKDTESIEQHGYILVAPTFDFSVEGQPMTSGTELRRLYASANQQQRQKIIADLFGKYTREAEQIMNNKIPTASAEPVAEAREPYQQGIDNLTLHWIKRMNDEIDEIKQRIGTEKLPAEYREKLKQKIEQLKAERNKLAFNPR